MIVLKVKFICYRSVSVQMVWITTWYDILASLVDFWVSHGSLSSDSSSSSPFKYYFPWNTERLLYELFPLNVTYHHKHLCTITLQCWFMARVVWRSRASAWTASRPTVSVMNGNSCSWPWSHRGWERHMPATSLLPPPATTQTTTVYSDLNTE